MRLVVLFLAVVAAVLLTVAALNWWVDPFGEFYDGSPLAAAAAAAPPCVVSDDLIGTASWLRFKEDVFERRRPRTIVIGTSRVLKLRSWPGERDFANLGIPGAGIETLAPLFRRLHAKQARPLTVYLGVEPFWLNRIWQPSVTFGSGFLSSGRYLLARQNFTASFELVRRDPSILFRRFHRTTLARRCVIDRGSRVVEGQKNAWDTDGSFEYTFELVPAAWQPPADDFTRDVLTFQGVYYRDWHELDRARLRLLDEAIARARVYGWRVVGFALPYSSRYVRRLSTAPETARRWREFGRIVPALFRHHGFTFLDLRDVRAVPCAESAFVDDGWHPNAACAARLRAHLDAAAGLRR